MPLFPFGSSLLPDEADVCVIGSGPAGAVVAVSLAERGCRVALVEAGTEANAERATDGIGRLDVGGAADVQFGRAVQLGGSSNLWAGRVAPLEPADFEARDWIPGSGWPIGAADLAPYYERAFMLTGAAPTDAFDAVSSLPGPWGPLLTSGDVETKMFSWASPPFRVAQWLKERRLDTLSIVTGATVTELLADEQGRVTAARIRAASGETASVRARFFVLAAGGIEVVRILLNSRSRFPHGLGNEQGNVGRYFSTHPKADIAALLIERRVRTDHPLFSNVMNKHGRFRAGIGLTRDAQLRHGLPNHYVQLSPLLEYRMSRLFERARTSSAISSPLVDRTAVARGFLQRAGLIVFEGIGQIARVQPRAGTFTLRAFLDQYPDADNRITLSRETDARGVPKADVRWRFADKDRQSVLDFLAVLDSAFRAFGIGRIEHERLKQMQQWPLTAIHSHFMGGTRMGDDPRTSVVDRDCRVHTAPNLYIAGPSLFPTYGFANPFLTIAALSYRLADCLAVRVGAPDAG